MSTLHTKPQITINLQGPEFRLITHALTGTLKEADEDAAEMLGTKLLDQLIKEEERRLGGLKAARAKLEDIEKVPPLEITVLRPGSTLGLDGFAPYGGPTPTSQWAGEAQ